MSGQLTQTMTEPIPAEDRCASAAFYGLAAALPVVVMMFGWGLPGVRGLPGLPAWGLMWLLAFSVFMACKLVTVARALPGAGGREAASAARIAGFLWGYAGMDARRFLGHERAAAPAAREWLAAMRNLALGATLVWGMARLFTNQPILAGWIGMIGLILFLHFGLFNVLSLAWRRGGVPARGLMNAPLRARGVAEFWSRRWNSGFNELAHAYMLRPLAGRVGLGAAVMVTFFASGLVHELVISLPAAHAGDTSGVGLPTAYFTLQGAAVLLERSGMGERLGLGRGLRGWCFTAVVVAGPAYGLFYPEFVRSVAVPFLSAIGALS